MKIALEGTGRVSLMASEEDDDPVTVQSACQRRGDSYVAVFDPLDGSRNIDASIPTGTIFGLYNGTGYKCTVSHPIASSRAYLAAPSQKKCHCISCVVHTRFTMFHSRAEECSKISLILK